jgi:SAM-dependent methyltransferase/uncharacterized protein YbaR (Trm112 family)
MLSYAKEGQSQEPVPITLWTDLVCHCCGYGLSIIGDGPIALFCPRCSKRFPVVNGIPRLAYGAAHDIASVRNDASDRDQLLRLRTTASFGFEWSRFPEMYPEWQQNFHDYMFPHTPEYFQGKKILDVGCGMGRHAYYAARYGAEVWAVEVSDAVEVAARNTEEMGVRVIQADLNHLPFQAETFDLVYTLGVLHHLPDPEHALHYLLSFVKPGGEFRMFLYWRPDDERFKVLLLKVATALRIVTVRMPHRLLYPLAYIAAFLVWASFVLPYRLFSLIPRLAGLADQMPLRQYSRYRFRTCVNDQFDRFSAPLERRYTRGEVEELLGLAGLEEQNVFPNFGWVAYGRKPACNHPAR